MPNQSADEDSEERWTTRSKFGVGIKQPYSPLPPKPRSSINTMSTFGASSGGVTGSGKSAFESLYVLPILPLNGPVRLEDDSPTQTVAPFL
jgi:hypothetical protein